jgi:prevent-host-death family protein
MGVPIYKAQAQLSQLVKQVRDEKHSIIITVDGVPAAELQPVRALPAPLSASDVTIYKSLVHAIQKEMKNHSPFSAVELINDGRR